MQFPVLRSEGFVMLLFNFFVPPHATCCGRALNLCFTGYLPLLPVLPPPPPLFCILLRYSPGVHPV